MDPESPPSRVLSDAVDRLLSSKSVPPKEKKSKLPPHRASDGLHTFYSRLPSPSEDDDNALEETAVLARAISEHGSRLRLDSKDDLDLDGPDLRSSTLDVLKSPRQPQQDSSSLSAFSVQLEPGSHGQQQDPDAEADGAQNGLSEGAQSLLSSSTATSLSRAEAKEKSPLRSSAPVASSVPGASEVYRKEEEEEREGPSFSEFLHSELNPEPLYPTTDAIWGQTERQRVYNAIAYVPYQLERLVWFGTLLCCDSFLAVFTILPVRFLRALHSMVAFDGLGRYRKLKIQGQQLTDVLCVMMFAVTFLFLRSLDAGAIYFWMKDLTQEFLKLQVIYTAVEMFDKITCSFTVDSLEALSGTCTLFTSSPNKRNHLRHLVSDFLVTLSLVMLHGLILMCQGMAFSVAMNSKRNHALVALIIATNFVEIKGTIFKRFDTTKLFVMTCQDVVERFHLCLSLLFVVAEEMDNSSRWWPNAFLLWRCAQIFGAEICIDVIKHAVLGKFNEIRPGVYREFTRDVCEKIKSSHSHNIHKIVYFEPFAPAALFLRMVSAMLFRREKKLQDVDVFRILLNGFFCFLGFGVLCGIKILLGFWLKGGASAYVRHFERRQKKATARPSIVRVSVAGNIGKVAKRD